VKNRVNCVQYFVAGGSPIISVVRGDDMVGKLYHGASLRSMVRLANVLWTMTRGGKNEDGWYIVPNMLGFPGYLARRGG